MARLKLLLAYVGTNYHGWQTQIRTDKIVPTVQTEMEKAIAKIIGYHTHVHGAGRTDAGVHAAGQVAHVDVPELPKMNWQLAINTNLPPDIRVVEVEAVADTFHAQHMAKGKQYAYRLWLDKSYTPPWLYPFVWPVGPLNLEAMLEAKQYLIGTHNFESFKNAGTNLLSHVRTLDKIWVESEEKEQIWYFEADGFLKQMVRNLMGLLVAIGQKKLQPEQIPSILEAKNRRIAPRTARPYGLILKKVYY